MNIEQAIKNLEDIKSKYTWSIGADVALDMAISALRAQNLQQTCNKLATNTIDRQVAIDAILREYNTDDSDYPTDYQQGLSAAKRIIEQMPSAKMEIVRCRECKHCEHWYADKGRCFLWHEDGISVFEDGFCNYAERKTDDDGRDQSADTSQSAG